MSRCLHATAGRKFLVLNYVGCVSAGLEDEVNPIKGGGRVWIWDADPFPWLRVAGTFVQAPRDAGGDGLLASPVGRVVAHPEFGEALPVFLLRVPQVFDSRAAVFRKSVPVSEASESQRGTACVEN
ncbi:unnamed protein product [Sphagnum jensenii]|uniref:Uncharacterized protein n=1 Tax=Sphagnum jensenii TaxID=128206 RepID=A0ABP0W6E1_9BRYO